MAPGHQAAAGLLWASTSIGGAVRPNGEGSGGRVKEDLRAKDRFFQDGFDL